MRRLVLDNIMDVSSCLYTSYNENTWPCHYTPWTHLKFPDGGNKIEAEGKFMLVTNADSVIHSIGE